ncbi:unnamed protein product [Euphydryas editha]|uniref:Uncharacterized protein n=1 Tax=Euphydryas editha TaxID=104508 RepID=A0AAU9UVC4_EUPED|nr:unnamed protein product [Euphydryas editha]
MHSDLIICDKDRVPQFLTKKKWQRPVVLSVSDWETVWKKEFHGRFYKTLHGPQVDSKASSLGKPKTLFMQYKIRAIITKRPRFFIKTLLYVRLSETEDAVLPVYVGASIQMRWSTALLGLAYRHGQDNTGEQA